MPRTVLLTCLAAALALAPAAQAQDTRSQIFRECQDGALRGDYSSQEIRNARNNIPDDIDQYSNCRDVLSRALTSRAGGGGDGGGGSSGGSGGGGGGGAGGAPLTPSTDDDRRALDEAATSGGTAQEIDGRSIVPGAAGLATGAVRNALPATVIVLLALLAVAAAAGAAPVARRGAAGLRRVLPGGSR